MRLRRRSKVVSFCRRSVGRSRLAAPRALRPRGTQGPKFRYSWVELGAEVGSEQCYLNAPVLFAAIARLVVGGWAGLSVTDRVHAEQRDLAIEGQIPNHGSRTAPAEAHVGRRRAEGVGEAKHE